jgi:hypothetical protein
MEWSGERSKPKGSGEGNIITFTGSTSYSIQHCLRRILLLKMNLGRLASQLTLDTNSLKFLVYFDIKGVCGGKGNLMITSWAVTSSPAEGVGLTPC